MVQFLLEHGADFSVRDHSSSLRLHVAVQPSQTGYGTQAMRKCKTGIAQSLINAGPDVEARDKTAGFTALRSAGSSHGC